jgi:hypothetical protein
MQIGGRKVIMIKGMKVNKDGTVDLSVSSTGGRYKEKLRDIIEEDLRMEIPWEDHRYEDIKTRAWLKWNDAGCPPGDGVEFWLAAEQEYEEGQKRFGELKIYSDPPIAEGIPRNLQIEWEEPPVIEVTMTTGTPGCCGTDIPETPPFCGTSFPTTLDFVKNPKCEYKEEKKNPPQPLPPKKLNLGQRLSKWWEGLIKSP